MLPTMLDDRSDRIDKTGPLHVWAQIADDIRRDLDSGALQPGAKLPSEPELATQYGSARVSVRRAIQELVTEDRLIIVRGRGTYVKA
jgi:GntR family transcriptional regulator